MLSNVKLEKKLDLSVTTPKMEHPFPIKKHLDSLAPESVLSIKQHVGKKLLKMHYAKQLEDIFKLYDCLDPLIEKKYFESLVEDQNSNNFTQYTGIAMSMTAIAIFLKFRGHAISNLESWVKEIYAISYIGIFTYAANNFWSARNLQKSYVQSYDVRTIMNARNEIHANNVNIINSLRFNTKELI